MAIAILPLPSCAVNSNIEMYDRKSPLATPKINDLLEIIKILLKYILSQKRSAHHHLEG